MQAVVMTTAGGPEVLHIQDMPMPELRSPTDMRVRLWAASVNPVDTKIRQRGPYITDGSSIVLGLDGAGVVDAVGPAVRLFSPGDAVYFCQGGLGGHPGTYAEYAVIDERLAAPKPANLSFEEAAAAPLALITAWESLYDRGRLEAGQRVLIHGGAGGVGHMAIQLAKLRGALVCTTISHETKANLATQLGADHCIYYRRIDFIEGVHHWTSDRGVDLAFDTVGEPVLSQTFHAVKVYGDVVTLHSSNADTQWGVARTRNLRVSHELTLTPMLTPMPEARQHQAKILARCASWFETGQLKIHLGTVLPLDQVVHAHQLVEAGETLGKLVLTLK